MFGAVITTPREGPTMPTADDPLLKKPTLRKVYLRLVPYCFLLYILSYIDRINVSFASLTMNKDLDLTAYVYGLAAGAFFWGYCLREVPSNICRTPRPVY
jgi:MFS transporter, ACS family, tartrate transporter